MEFYVYFQCPMMAHLLPPPLTPLNSVAIVTPLHDDADFWKETRSRVAVMLCHGFYELSNGVSSFSFYCCGCCYVHMRQTSGGSEFDGCVQKTARRSHA